MTDEVRRQDTERMSTRTSTFTAEVASNFAKMRNNAFKRNKALLKVRSDAKSSKTEQLPSYILQTTSLNYNGNYMVKKVKQSRYTPWRRLGGEEV
jgi:hypothetical protein